MEPQERTHARVWLARRAPLLFGAAALFLSVFILIIVEIATGH
jgi:hypothetical protein